VILFAVGIIALSYLELGLVVRVPDSTAADYIGLANDLTPILRAGASPKGSDALDPRIVISVTSSAAPAQDAHADIELRRSDQNAFHLQQKAHSL